MTHQHIDRIICWTGPACFLQNVLWESAPPAEWVMSSKADDSITDTSPGSLRAHPGGMLREHVHNIVVAQVQGLDGEEEAVADEVELRRRAAGGGGLLRSNALLPCTVLLRVHAQLCLLLEIHPPMLQISAQQTKNPV